MKASYNISSLFILLLFSSSAFCQLTNGFRLTLSSGPYSDESVIRFFDGATNTFDPDYDGYKLKNSGNTPNLYTVVSGNSYSINSLSDSFLDLNIPLHAEVAFNGSYTLKFEEIWDTDSLCIVTLIDSKLGISQDLKSNSIYSFDCQMNEPSDRFIINFKKKTIDAIPFDSNNTSPTDSTNTISTDSTNTISPDSNTTVSIDSNQTFSQLLDSTTIQIPVINVPLTITCFGDRIIIRTDEITSEVVVVLNDLSGKQIFRKTIIPNSESVEFLAPTNGFQVIKVTAGNQQYFGKIYVESL